MQTIVREMRGIPLWLLREYLEEMGGTAVDDHFVQANGWNVRLTCLEPFRLGSLEVGQTRLDIEIDNGGVDEFIAAFDKKTMRAGA